MPVTVEELIEEILLGAPESAPYLLDESEMLLEKIRRKERVYFIQNTRTKHIKIGYTTDVRRRFRTMCSDNVDGLVLLGRVKGERKLEAALHRKFKEHRHRKTEWFRPAEEILQYIQENKMYRRKPIGKPPDRLESDS